VILSQFVQSCLEPEWGGWSAPPGGSLGIVIRVNQVARVMNVTFAISVARPLTLQDSPCKRTFRIGRFVPLTDQGQFSGDRRIEDAAERMF
jgi:hypothetical protein